MEFPEDIRLIISQFSRPHFKLFREYNRALRVHHLSAWPSLKHALMTNPDKVLDALQKYEKAKIEAELYNLWFQKYLDNHSVEEERHLRSLESHTKKFKLSTMREELHFLVNYGQPLRGPIEI